MEDGSARVGVDDDCSNLRHVAAHLVVVNTAKVGICVKDLHSTK